MPYVDGFVLVLPKRKLAAYKRMAATAGKVWKEHGALEYRECVAEQLAPDTGGSGIEPGFPRMTHLKRGETVVFSWIVYRSRAHRDRVNAKVMKDPRITSTMDKPMPFDMERFAYAGFETIVDL